MKRLILSAALCLAAPLALAGDKAGAKADAEKSCGQKLAENAKYPQQLNRVLTSAADFYQAHAQWIGTGDEASKAEHAKLLQLVKEHRAMAEEARELSESLQASSSLPAAQHTRPPTPELRQSMERLQREMRNFAQLLERGARENQQALQAMKRTEVGAQQQQGTGGSGSEGETEAMDAGTGGAGETGAMDAGTGGAGMEPPPPAEEPAPAEGAPAEEEPIEEAPLEDNPPQQ
jgi:hypothetical protein